MDRLELAKELRKITEDVAAEPLPRRFAELLGDEQVALTREALTIQPLDERKAAPRSRRVGRR